MILICALHLGHSKGSISYTRFMHAAQDLSENRANYEQYQREFAPAIDGRHQQRFGEGATTFATVLEVLENFERATH